MAAFRYDTGADGTAFWRCVTHDNSGSPTVTTTTMPIAAGTLYRLRIVCQAGFGNVKFYINDTLVATHTTHLPDTTQALSWLSKITNLNSTSKGFRFYRMALLQK
jgi:hypothetical protein